MTLTCVNWDVDLHAIAAAAQHAILFLAHLSHGIDKPDTASDQYDHDGNSDRVHPHSVAVVVLGAAGVFAKILYR